MTMSTQSLMQITTRHFNINSDKFYYHNRKTWMERGGMEEIIKELDYQNHETRTIPFPVQNDDLPDIFMTSSPAMIASFKRFG